jgi:cell division initiation protein
MAITPADIEKKTFSTALRGYDLDEVDDFLDEMVVAVRDLEEQLAAARARVAELENDPDAPAPVATLIPVQAPSIDEASVGRALVAAQQAADRLLEDARSEADRKLEETQAEADRLLEGARTEADTFARDRDLKKAEIESEMAELNSLVAGVRTRLAMLATAVADKLDEMDAVVAGSTNRDASHGLIGEEALESSSEPDFASFDETADASIDLGGDDEIEIAVGEALIEAEAESGDEAELDLDADDAGSAEIEDVEDDEDDEDEDKDEGNSGL